MSENQVTLSSAPVVIVRSAPQSNPEISSVGMIKVGQDLTATTAGCQHISMRHGIMAPRKKASAHYHPFETVIYMIRGTNRTYYGPNLEHYVDVVAGDYVYIPPFVLHQPVNESDEEMEFVAAQPVPEDHAIMPPGSDGHFEH